jgi:hypothetical protein
LSNSYRHRYLGIELEEEYCTVARTRPAGVERYRQGKKRRSRLEGGRMIPVNADSPDVQPCDAVPRLLQVLTMIAAIPLWGEATPTIT